MLDELISPLLTAPWSRRAGLGVFLAMVVLTFVTFVHSIFTWHNDLKLAHTTTAHYSDTSSSQLAQLIEKIPEWHLFGKYGAASAILPITSLQIRLVGVIKATPEKDSRVLISESNQPAKVYRVGDTLPGSGVKIYAITTEGVVLNNSGRLEKLPLPRTPLLFQGMPKPLSGDN